MSQRFALPNTAIFAVLYLLAVLAGKLAVMDELDSSVIWPATAVAAVWMVVRNDSRGRWTDAALLFVLTVGGLAVTGTSLSVAAVHGLVALLEAVVFAVAAARWLPDVWAGDGEEGSRRPLAHLDDLWRLLLVATPSAFCGALLGTLGEELINGDRTVGNAAVWLVRDVVSVLLFSTVARRIAAPPRDERMMIEAAAVLLVSVGAYFYVFEVNDTLPIGFALIPVTVWAGLRLPTLLAIAHTMLFGTIAAVLTLHGTGPYAEVAGVTSRALIIQIYVGILALVSLTLAFSRDEREALIARMSVSEQEATEKAGLMTGIVNSMTEGLAILDQSGKLVLRNPAAGRLLGSTSTVAAGTALASDYGFFHPDGTPLTDAELPYQRALAGEDVQPMDVLIRNAAVPEGRIVRFNVSRLATHPGGPQHVVVVFHDVTADRRHRDELMSFAGVVAHDLLNPLTTIEGWAEVLETELAGYKPAERVSRIQRAAARMRTFLNGLLAYTAARDGKLMPTTINLQLLLTDIANSRYDHAESAGKPPPQFAFGQLDAVEGDPVLVRQLIECLIDYAIDNTVPGNPPQLSVASQAVTSGMIRIDILDAGIGIPEGQRPSVFSGFHRAEDPGRSGLELAICKRIVERHGGAIEAGANPYGNGTRMSFTLPVGRSAYARTLENEWNRQAVGMTSPQPR
ncbi:ATP-binding protein [Actinoplanes sp. NPDC051851]|uniref:ATP-binding protein n=1 Tax=Actinoplanes sp. NPDC051851 TaxID=3154753 RepID=UPI00344A5363